MSDNHGRNPAIDPANDDTAELRREAISDAKQVLEMYGWRCVGRRLDANGEWLSEIFSSHRVRTIDLPIVGPMRGFESRLSFVPLALEEAGDTRCANAFQLHVVEPFLDRIPPQAPPAVAARRNLVQTGMRSDSGWMVTKRIWWGSEERWIELRADIRELRSITREGLDNYMSTRGLVLVEVSNQASPRAEGWAENSDDDARAESAGEK